MVWYFAYFDFQLACQQYVATLVMMYVVTVVEFFVVLRRRMMVERIPLERPRALEVLLLFAISAFALVSILPIAL